MSRNNDPTDVFKLYDMTGGPDACWRFKGAAWGGQAREKRPYFMAAKRRQIAYRWIYELVHGVTLTPDQIILHSCDNGGYPIGCGNPAHLRLGTTQENTDDMMQRERHGLPRSVVKAIRTLLDKGRVQHEIADLYGISRECVSSIATQRVYKTRGSDGDDVKIARERLAEIEDDPSSVIRGEALENKLDELLSDKGDDDAS